MQTFCKGLRLKEETEGFTGTRNTLCHGLERHPLQQSQRLRRPGVIKHESRTGSLLRNEVERGVECRLGQVRNNT